jgi:hypothetical protein
MLRAIASLALLGTAAAFTSPAAPLRTSRGALAAHRAAQPGLRAARASTFPAFLPQEMSEIEDPACIAMAQGLQRTPVEIPAEFATAPIETSFAKTACAPAGGAAPVLLLHGFDSSVLEFRRLLPELQSRGIAAWAMDILGWGFTARAPAAADFSPAAKRAHLRAFIEKEIGAPVTLVGASLGGANPRPVASLLPY